MTDRDAISGERWNRLAGLALVLAMHGAVFYAAWSYRLLPAPDDAVTLFVEMVNPPPAQKKEEPPPPPPPKKVRLEKPLPVTAPPQPVLVSNAPVTAPIDPVATTPTPAAVVEAPSAPSAPALAPMVEAPPLAPIMLTSDLAVACPQRIPPEYPAISRRLMEQGKVILRVELDETGRVSSAMVKESSGFKRLDEAGLAAVKQWHCTAPVRNGDAVRAVALQPFDFVLEGRK